MKKSVTCVIALCCAVILFAQNPATKAPSHFVIKGKAKNFTQPYWEFAMTGIFEDNEHQNVQFLKDGTFSKTVSLSQPQDLYLYLGYGNLTLFAVPDDTIELNWDYKDVNNTLQVTSPKPWRQTELNLKMKLDKRDPVNTEKLYEALQDKKTSDSAKFEHVIIDQNGNIANNNASGKGELLRNRGENEIDKLLK
jgi:hypothetical protein